MKKTLIWSFLFWFFILYVGGQDPFKSFGEAAGGAQKGLNKQAKKAGDAKTYSQNFNKYSQVPGKQVSLEQVKKVQEDKFHELNENEQLEVAEKLKDVPGIKDKIPASKKKEAEENEKQKQQQELIRKKEAKKCKNLFCKVKKFFKSLVVGRDDEVHLNAETKKDSRKEKDDFMKNFNKGLPPPDKIDASSFNKLNPFGDDKTTTGLPETGMTDKPAQFPIKPNGQQKEGKVGGIKITTPVPTMSSIQHQNIKVSNNERTKEVLILHTTKTSLIERKEQLQEEGDQETREIKEERKRIEDEKKESEEAKKQYEARDSHRKRRRRITTTASPVNSSSVMSFRRPVAPKLGNEQVVSRPSNQSQSFSSHPDEGDEDGDGYYYDDTTEAPSAAPMESSDQQSQSETVKASQAQTQTVSGDKNSSASMQQQQGLKIKN